MAIENWHFHTPQKIHWNLRSSAGFAYCWCKAANASIATVQQNSRFFYMLTIDEIHIGKLIEEQLKQKRISTAQLAKALNCRRQNIYDIFKRKSLDTELLVRISQALDYDFLTAAYLPLMPKSKIEVSLVIEIEGNECKVVRVE